MVYFVSKTRQFILDKQDQHMEKQCEDTKGVVTCPLKLTDGYGFK